MDAAKAEKALRIVKAHEAITEATYQASVAQERALEHVRRAKEHLAEWEGMTPNDVMRIMAGEQRDDAQRNQGRAEEQRLADIHRAALRVARRQSKGILPPEASNKSLGFGLVGAVIGAALLDYIGWFHLGWSSQFALALLAVLGAVLGLIVALWFFHANFVVDESLRGPLFDRDA